MDSPMAAASDTVRQNYDYLVDHLKVTDVLPKLVSEQLVDPFFNEELANKTQKEQVQHLLNEILRSSDPQWFEKFTRALSDTNLHHATIAKRLREDYAKKATVKRSRQPGSVTTVNAGRSRTGPPLSTGSSAVPLPSPSPSAPNPTLQTDGTDHQDDPPPVDQEVNCQSQDLEETVQSPPPPPKVAPKNRPTSCPQGDIKDITDVSFAILVANENEYKAVLNYFGMGFTMVTEGQLYTDDVLDCTFATDPVISNNGGAQDPGLTRRSDDYYSISINGKTGIIYQTASIGSYGRQGAMLTTVQVLKDARERRWPLEIIFVVGCTGGHAKPGEEVECGQVIVPGKVIEYNRGKFETGRDGQPKRIIKPEMWPTSDKWRKSVTEISIRDGGEDHRGIKMAEGDYDYCGDFVVKDAGIAAELRTTIADPKMIGIEMEGVGVATAIKVAETLGFGLVPEFLIVKGISDNADGNKGDCAPMLFFAKTYDAVYPDDRQVMAALQSVTLAARAVHKRIGWKYCPATEHNSWCLLM